MTPIALLKVFSSKEFVTTIEVTNMQRCSGKANNLRYTHNKRDAGGHLHHGTVS